MATPIHLKKKLLIICGPTATGKTSLAIKLAKKFTGELISADSRQVYKGMDIGTGKDIPKDFKYRVSSIEYKGKKVSFYGNATKIWGYDLVQPDEEFSVSQFTQIAWKVIKHLWKLDKLPIIVGGTGLYLDQLLTPATSLNIPPNKSLRKKLEKLSIQKLQIKLKQLNSNRFYQMNNSDKHNPRRLIRAIEIAKSINAASKEVPSASTLKNTETLWVGLKASLKKLDQKIDSRVVRRINQGMTEEVKKLDKVIHQKNLPSTSSLGYRQWQSFLEGKISREKAITIWQTAEHQYARRQITWFKRIKTINWFDVENINFSKQVVELVKNWYATSN